MKHKQVILLDLDGTVIDSSEGIFACVRYALSKFGIEEPDDRKLYGFIGPPLCASFRQFYAFDEQQTAQAVAYYRERYSTKGIEECRLYPGMRELLQGLHVAGKCVLIATLKPEAFSKIILKKLGAAPLLDGIYGADFEGRIQTKQQVIEAALEAQGITNLKSCVMIGDRKSDIQGAREAGMDAIGVTFGFGDADEFDDVRPTAVVDSAAQLKALLL